MSTILRFKYLILLGLFPLILVSIWFRNGLILGGGEEGLIFYSPLRAYEISKSTWFDYDTGEPNLYWLPRLPFLLFSSFLVNNLFLPSYLAQAIIFFLLMLTGIWSVYFLTLELLDKDKQKSFISFISALFYLFNPFSMSQIWGRGLYPMFFSFALLPLSLLLLIKGLKHKQIIYVLPIVFSAAIFSAAFGTVTFTLTYWVVLILLVFWWLFSGGLRREKIIFGMFFTGLLFIGWVIISAWWLFPLILVGNKIFAGNLVNNNENLGTLLGVSRNFTPDIIIRLLQRTYFFDPSAYSKIYSGLSFQLISFIPPIFVILGIVKIVRDKNCRQFNFSLLLLIVGLVVSLGANPPFGKLFVWVFNRITILQAFRNPFEKFGLVYVLGYAPLFALGTVYLLRQSRVKIVGLFIALILTCGVFAWPMWTGRILTNQGQKVGVKVPEYYRELNNWLGSQDIQSLRIIMTPLFSGEGAVYQWGDSRYNGADYMMHILDYPTISSIFQIPFYQQFAQNLRKYIGQIDVSAPLGLLRAKFLVDRKDTLGISDAERNHAKYLTEVIYPPVAEINLDRICNDIIAHAKEDQPAWVVCQIPAKGNNWSNIKYLHIKVKTNVSSFLDIAIRDKNGVRIRWDGRMDSEYSTNNDDWTTITIPLGNPTEPNFAMEFSRVDILEVQAHPKDNALASVWEINLKEVSPDPGKEEKIDAYHLAATFGKLDVYQPNDFKSALEFGSLSSIVTVKSFSELFEQASQQKDQLDKTGFLLIPQNQDKNLQDFTGQATVETTNKDKISGTRYWLRFNTDKGKGYLVLSQAFNPLWKVIPGISQPDMAGSLLKDLRLLQKSTLEENQHFVVNGYANLWTIGGADQYGIVFLPQIIADLSVRITLWGGFVLLIISIIWLIKNKIMFTSSH